VVEAVNALAAGVAIVSPDLRIVSCNDSLVSAFGVAPGDYVGRMFWELLPGGPAAPEAEMILATARDGSPRSCCSLVHDLALEIHATQLMSGFVVIEVADSTVQARLERRFDHLLASMSDGLCVIDSRKRLTYWNAAAERMTGLRSEDIVGRHVSVAFGHMGGSQLASRFIESLRQKSPSELRSWSYDGDASGRAAGIYDAFIFPVEGSGALVIFREVGERVRQERELLERRTEAEALHAVVRSIAAVTDSAELRRLLAYAAMERCEARGSVVVEVQGSEGIVTAAAGENQPLVGTHIPMAGSLTERVIRSEEVVAISNYAAEYPEHQRRLMGELMGPVLATPLVAHDRALGVLIVSRAPGAQLFSARSRERLRVMADHAALGLWKLHLLDEAQAANLAKSDFMATMSHELRTPLAALAGYGEILSEQVAGPLSPEQMDVVERMRSVTNHLAALIDEILTYSSLDAGRESVELTDVVLADVVREAVAVAEPLALQKGISLDYHVPEMVKVCTDPDKLRQILVHLLGNAIKFTEKGFVHFNTREEGRWIRMSIEDSGIGIADENRQRLFQPFSQLDAGLRRRHRGAGLGLFISQRLAGLIGGSIDYRSALGQGSSFTLSIPALDQRRTRKNTQAH
jgi:PAS domain S-box-containing protein